MAEGRRHFIACGGDGTGWEVVNGMFAAGVPDGPPPVLGVLPLGTGNSFLRDFSERVDEDAFSALVEGRRRRVDVMRLEHAEGTLYSVNLLSVGFVADICTTANRRFKRLGQLSYVLGVFVELANVEPSVIPVRMDGREDRAPMTFLSFNNSRFTGGKMMMAPTASAEDGWIEVIRAGAMTRGDLLRTFPKIFAGTHVHHPRVETSRVKRVEFLEDAPLDVMVDGEVLTVRPRVLDLLPGALEVVI
jgi:YegS/Rv2252/BmrU family lipid kinase